MVRLLFGLWALLMVLANRRSLTEGLAYLRDLRAWNPQQREPVLPDGPFGLCFPLAYANNAGRAELIRTTLRAAGIAFEELPVPDEALPNIFVPASQPGPLTLLIAHYDKSRETTAYHGACDNTAAVAVLLEALRRMGGPGACALLFSAAEERGYLGARAFLATMHARGQAIRAVINFDMLGRGRIAIRPSALPGFYIAVPPLGMFVYDGRRLRYAARLEQPDQSLVHHMQQLLGTDLVVYTRFTASSDSNVFQAAGIPTVALSSDNMFYLDSIWERDSDRVELLDQQHLRLAVNGVLTICKTPA